MKIAFVDKKNAVISVVDKVLKVDEKKIPFRLIDTLILATSTELKIKDITKITEEGISILLLSSRGDKVSMVRSFESKNANIKLAQYKAQIRSLEFAKYFVYEKIIRHTQQLEDFHHIIDNSKALVRLEKSKSIEGLLGVEGSFSRLYFKGYFSLFSKRLHLGKRSKQPPLDPVNAMMSFSYMMVHNIITVRLLSFGFEPSIGFLHKPFRSHNALSSDFMELFRADINSFVLELFSEKILKGSDFSKTKSVYLKYEARRKIWGRFQTFIKKLEPKIDKEIASFKLKLGA